MAEDTATLARPYAKAAFEYAQEQGEVDRWLEGLNKLSIAFEEPKMHEIMSNPEFEIKQQMDFIQRAVGDLSEDIKNFLHLLIESKRYALIGEIQHQFKNYHCLSQNTKQVEITTAIELSGSDKDGFGASLSKHFGCPIDLSYEVDPKILGGAVIRAGDQIIDGSVAGRMQALTRDMAAASVY